MRSSECLGFMKAAPYAPAPHIVFKRALDRVLGTHTPRHAIHRCLLPHPSVRRAEVSIQLPNVWRVSRAA
jgi:hypothetical protein